MWRLIPTRAMIWAVLVALGAAALTWLRADARKDARTELEKKDSQNAQAIHNAAADARRDGADGVRPHADDGWRD